MTGNNRNGMIKINVYLNFEGKTEEAFTFYKSIFGGDFSSLVRFREMPIPGVTVPEEDLDKIMHVSLPIGTECVLMGTDTLPSLKQKLTEGNNINLSIHPDTDEEADRIFAGLSEGGEVEMPMGVQMWGDYYGMLRDKFGIPWMVNVNKPKEG